MTDIVSAVNKDYDDACVLIDQQRYEEARQLLLPLVEKIRDFPLSEDTDWKDFERLPDALVYSACFGDADAGRKLVIHPLHPARILFTLGSLLIEMGRPDEALEPLQMLLVYDPVCPKYLFELGDAYKRVGMVHDAYSSASWALSFAANDEELARCYRDLGYCLAEMGSYEDAAMLNLLSLRYRLSRHAQEELDWLRKNHGVSADNFSEEMIRSRCGELGIQIGMSDVMRIIVSTLEKLPKKDE